MKNTVSRGLFAKHSFHQTKEWQIIIPNDEDITKHNLLLHLFLIFQDEVENRKRVRGVEVRKVFLCFHLFSDIIHHFDEEHELPAGLYGTFAC